MKKNSKRLGSQFERDIARLLSAWILGKNIENKEEVKNIKLVVWRVGSSGSVATINKQQNMHGDIVAIDEIAIPVLERFNFEVKRRKNFNLFSILNNEKKLDELFSWFMQARIDDYIPILILKVMYVGWYAITDISSVYKLKCFCYDLPQHIRLMLNGKTLVVFDLIDFLKWSYRYVRILIKDKNLT